MLRTNFEVIPPELEESVKVDGGTDLQILKGTEISSIEIKEVAHQCYEFTYGATYKVTIQERDMTIERI